MSPPDDPCRTSGAAALEARELAVAYPGVLVLDGLDLGIPRGAFTALVGPNGCGKSTLLRAFGRQLAPLGGSVLLDGRPIVELSSKEVARRVGLLPQGPVAPEGLTVAELVRQGRYPHRSLFGGWTAEDQAACEQALRLTNLADLADRPLDSLSGGQRQRAWIAMTLAQQSGVLLLDEPTTYLDIAHQEEVLDLLRGLVEANGTTIVAVLHDINQAARHADHIVMLRDGAVVAEGPPAEVITQAQVEHVFGLRAAVIKSPLDGAPLILPLSTRR